MSHHEYREWLDKVEIEIGMWSIKWSPQPMFEPLVEKKLGIGILLVFTQGLSEFGLIQAIHMGLTLPISHYKYNNLWMDKVEIGIHSPQPSPGHGFQSWM
eukprot:scaffold174646_cov43-Cyclotella_meneghiniana.AAC.1